MIKDFEETMALPEVKGFLAVNFWRPVELKTPLEYKPLAVCDPGSIKQEDRVFTGLDAGAVQGVAGKLTSQMALRFNPDHEHEWYMSGT